MRLPNVFTAIADVGMGYLFVRREITDGFVFGCLVAASAALYTAGMVFNDVFDREIDAKERPFRPIPSGRISLFSACLLAGMLLTVGIFLGWLAGLLPGATDTMPWRSGVVASLLAGCVLAYDAILKKTPLGPVAMGSCRLLNVLLGMSAAAPSGDMLLGYRAGELLAASGIGIYIAGVTWFARSEAGRSRSGLLIAAMIVMTMGVVLLGASARYVPLHFNRQDYGRHVYWLLLVLMMFSVLRRCGVAALDPAPQKVQLAVKHSILSLIWLDAATALVVAGPVYGLAIAALLIPALVLGRWVYST